MKVEGNLRGAGAGFQCAAGKSQREPADAINIAEICLRHEG